MKDQHTKITGYRDLSAEEIALMNEIKAKGAELDELVAKVRGHVADQRAHAVQDNEGDEVGRIDHAEPARWASIARTHFQEGLMALTRAVAQPSSF